MEINWRDYELVRKHVSDAKASLSQAINSTNACPFEAILDGYTYESPIEVLFVIWLESLFMYVGQARNCAFIPRAQQTVEVGGERFRPDFIIVPTDPLLSSLGEAVGCPMKLAVELDGHDFHERTKEQVVLRNRRDRVLQQHGWVVLHISGSELVTKQLDALREVWKCGQVQMERMRSAIAEEWGAPLSYSVKP